MHMGELTLVSFAAWMYFPINSILLKNRKEDTKWMFCAVWIMVVAILIGTGALASVIDSFGPVYND